MSHAETCAGMLHFYTKQKSDTLVCATQKQLVGTVKIKTPTWEAGFEFYQDIGRAATAA